LAALISTFSTVCAAVELRGDDRNVVSVDKTVPVYIAEKITFRAGDFEYIPFTTGTKASNPFRNRYFHIAGSRLAGKSKRFDVCVSFLFERSGFRPVFVVIAVINRVVL
jgi:hypothetical protein